MGQEQIFDARLAATERALIEHEPALHRFPPHQRKALIEFVIGNVLFVSTHELGHGVLAEFELPNLGHDEDAADNFAILTTLRVGDAFSDRVLIEATTGWFLADLKDKLTGEKPDYYDSHGIDLQRAYQIVCMMVGRTRRNSPNWPKRRKCLRNASTAASRTTFSPNGRGRRSQPAPAHS